MFDRLVKDVMDTRAARQLGPHTTVAAAARIMAQGRFGAVLVVDEGVLKGIFTERDALFRVIAQGRDPAIATVGEVMTPDPRTVAPENTYGYALVLMQEGDFRHAPVVENGRPIGILSSRNAMDPDLEDFVSEANRREHLSRGG